MPPSGVREVLEAMGAGRGSAAVTFERTALLEAHIQRIERCSLTDDLDELTGVSAAAHEALAAVPGASPTLVQLAATQLRAALAGLDRLIVQVKAESAVLTEPLVQPGGATAALAPARRAIREAAGSGGLSAKLKEPLFAEEVKSWMKTADPTDPEQRADMLAVIKAMDPGGREERQEAFEITFRTKVLKSEERNYIPIISQKTGKPVMDPLTKQPKVSEELKKVPLDPVALTMMADVMAQLPTEHMPSGWLLLGQTGDKNSRGSYNDATDLADLQFSLLDSKDGFDQPYASNCLPGDPLETAKAFDLMIRHECGHKAAAVLGADQLTGTDKAGRWVHHDTTERVLDALGSTFQDFVAQVQAAGGPEAAKIKAAVCDEGNGFDGDAIAEALGIKQADLDKFPRDHIVLQVLQQGAGRRYQCGSAPVSVGGRMYVVGGPDSGSWFSFDKAAWDKRLSLYQYAAPNEWFAEFYAAANNGAASIREAARTRFPKAWEWLDEKGAIVVGR
jgi:hypothetical protein